MCSATTVLLEGISNVVPRAGHRVLKSAQSGHIPKIARWGKLGLNKASPFLHGLIDSIEDGNRAGGLVGPGTNNCVR